MNPARKTCRIVWLNFKRPVEAVLDGGGSSEGESSIMLTNSSRLPLCWKPPGIERREKVPMFSRDGSSDRAERLRNTADGPEVRDALTLFAREAPDRPRLRLFAGVMSHRPIMLVRKVCFW